MPLGSIGATVAGTALKSTGLPGWAIWGLVTVGSGIIKAWTDPKPSYPELRETAEEKWFQSRVDMGAALVKRKKLASSMAATIMGNTQRVLGFKSPRSVGFDVKMKEIKSTLPASSSHADNIAILQTAQVYDDFVEDTKQIATRNISKTKVFSDVAPDIEGKPTKQPSIVIETTKGKAGLEPPEKKKVNILGQRLPDEKED